MIKGVVAFFATASSSQFSLLKPGSVFLHRCPALVSLQKPEQAFERMHWKQEGRSIVHAFS